MLRETSALLPTPGLIGTSLTSFTSMSRSASRSFVSACMLAWAFLRGSGLGTTRAGRGSSTRASTFGFSMGFGGSTLGGGFFCSRMNSTMRSGTGCSTTAGLGGMGSSGMMMPNAMNSPMTAAMMRRYSRSSFSDGVHGRS